MTFIGGCPKFIVYFITIMQHFNIDRADWDKTLEQIVVSYDVFASVKNESGQDYEYLNTRIIRDIAYNTAKPSTPLKHFFLPVRENVSDFPETGRERVILGVPNCDMEGLHLLDEIYLDKDFPDPFYRVKREHTLFISFDCLEVQEHCHCISYGVKPWASENGDLSVALLDNEILLTVISAKGAKFWAKFQPPHKNHPHGKGLLKVLDKKREDTIQMIKTRHSGLPDYRETGKLVQNAGEAIWKKYASRCVSCGACSTICPTCSCFLLTDKPGFEKVRQLDACQYPGFERVAGGEDALRRLHNRFKNRYMCKYVWKPEKFSSVACTGCGRCIEACIGKISKNELFMELTG